MFKRKPRIKFKIKLYIINSIAGLNVDGKVIFLDQEKLQT